MMVNFSGLTSLNNYTDAGSEVGPNQVVVDCSNGTKSTYRNDLSSDIAVGQNNDLDAVIEETSAIFDKATLLKFYKAATAKPYSFLYIKLTAKTTDDMFYESFSEPIIVTDASSTSVSK